jgi:hypothetical protein
MKASRTLVEGLTDLEQVAGSGDLRRIVANAMLALVRKEISGADVESLAKGLDSISNSLNAEVKVAKLQVEMRAQGGQLGSVAHLGQMVIGNPSKPTGTA